jgi:hypothetical protein
MKIDNLIQLHNEALNRKVEKNPFLNQRIKARLKDNQYTKFPALLKPLRKYALAYGFLFIILTLINFVIITGVKKYEPQPKQPVLLTMNAFEPTYPGSISQAYTEVMK